MLHSGLFLYKMCAALGKWLFQESFRIVTCCPILQPRGQAQKGVSKLIRERKLVQQMPFTYIASLV
jgi:hypothetical protein